MPHKTLKFKGSVFSIFFCFFSNFGTKSKHTGLNNSEYAKELVRISVLEKKLDLWWKLQFAHKTLKLKGSVFSIFSCFISIFGTKRKHTGLNNSDCAKEFVRIIVLE